MDLNERAKIVHQANIKWWQNIDTGEPIKRNPRELLMLAISEVAECLEGERKNLMDDKLPHRKMAEVEMADTYIRLLDFSAGFGHVLRPNHVDEGAIFVAGNKGEALFDLALLIVKAGTMTATGFWLTTCLHFIESYCGKHGYDLVGAMEEKMAYNRTRIDHTHEARRIAGGKQF